MNKISHGQKKKALFSFQNAWSVGGYSRLTEKFISFFSGIPTMDPPMQGCFLRQVVEKEEPGRQG